ncbi:galactokinase [Lapidilactobacillus luobeiensis]|uniref:galactokinase n=1 Tax=Lapidilactobacillus luobeiensis TaxID=2950371 RepID=UPI0021C2E4E6|nr:galactokinase [Lapidilactobacillus luobeiensis]
MKLSEINQDFASIFSEAVVANYFAPGRINLIGEHTDYNGGHVFPAAISLGTYAAMAPRQDQTLHLYSANFKQEAVRVIALDKLAFAKADGWTNFVKGEFALLQEAGHKFDHGLDIYFYGNLPAASGLSSSSSIELLTGAIINDVYQLGISQLDLIKLGQQVENQYIGVNSGIMDQFAIGMGRKDQAIFLDTNSLAYQYYPLDLQDYRVVIMNTNKPRALSDSKYNQRRAECEAALAELQRVVKITTLGDLSAETFDEYSYALDDEILLKRARHAVWENQRTIRAAQALTNHDLAEFGRLMNASHVSLEYDYEVTGLELDTLVHTAWQQAGVFGARMTGAGFGGCAIALVKNDQIPSFITSVGTVYAETVGYEAGFFVAQIADGPHKITETELTIE